MGSYIVACDFPPTLRLAMTQPAETERETCLFSLLIQEDRVLKALFNFHETAVD